MATVTVEQTEQKKHLLEEKVKQMKAIDGELVEAGAIEISEDDLDKAAGGGGGTPPNISFEWLLKENGGSIFL